ncbi:hypothetical protein HY933_02045 [Candidatus Falkowbacteria bacterium]|nr:hypothetical protein [Candidatus Falkowbacteria bacterium]
MKVIIVVVGTVVLMLVAVFLLANRSQQNQPAAAGSSNVSIVNGTQIITISARGGYLPRQTIAQAGLPTILRVNTKGTFDCSSVIYLPQINYQTRLPATGTTDIPLPSQAAGTTLQGLCAMGMYYFTLNFN